MTEAERSGIVENWQRLRAEISAAAQACGRDPQAVRLVAVSKRHPAEAIALLAALGQKDFGENYIQEAREKQDYLAEKYPELSINWHAIGPIQSNKAKDVAGRFTLIHSLSGGKLAPALARKMLETGQEEAQAVLLQVNIGREEQKSGLLPELLPQAVEQLLQIPQLDLRGLMCLPPNCGEGELARPYFRQLRQLRDSLEEQFGLVLPELSMGMSGDFVQATEEGASLVRVGTAIFGQRF